MIFLVRVYTFPVEILNTVYNVEHFDVTCERCGTELGVHRFAHELRLVMAKHRCRGE